MRGEYIFLGMALCLSVHNSLTACVGLYTITCICLVCLFHGSNNIGWCQHYPLRSWHCDPVWSYKRHGVLQTYLVSLLFFFSKHFQSLFRKGIVQLYLLHVCVTDFPGVCLCTFQLSIDCLSVFGIKHKQVQKCHPWKQSSFLSFFKMFYKYQCWCFSFLVYPSPLIFLRVCSVLPLDM